MKTETPHSILHHIEKYEYTKCLTVNTPLSLLIIPDKTTECLFIVLVLTRLVFLSKVHGIHLFVVTKYFLYIFN